MTIVLRQDQIALKHGVYEGWQSGCRNMLAVLPTGGGKSVIVSDIAFEKDQMGMRQAIIAHRNELVSQMSLHVARRGIRHRIIAPPKTVAQIVQKHRAEFNGFSFVNPSANASVVGVDTLTSASRQDTLKAWGAQINYWTIDEAHHVLAANKWGTAASMFPNALGLGVTATPSRADGKGLGRKAEGVFDHMVVGPTMRELIELGALTDYEIAVPESDFEIDDADLPPSGDFSPAKMKEASKRSHIVGDVVTEYCKRALGKRAICFATDVETAGKIAQNFNDFGVPAAAVSSDTPSEVRDEMVQRFRDGRIRVLVNVDLFGEGFDVPACEVVIMARPTASLSVYLQQFGRALRTMFGKTHGLIIDHVSNWKRHGFPDKIHFWTLDRREKKAKKKPDPEDIPLTVCRNVACAKPYERFHTACPYCGTVPPVMPMERNLEKIDGDLVLLDREKLAEMRAATILEDAQSLANRSPNGLAAAANAKNQIEKIKAQARLKEAIAQWAGIQRAKNRDDREIHKRFYIANGFTVLDALSSERSRQDYEKLAETVEGWYMQ